MCRGHERCSCHWRTYYCDNCDELQTTDGDLPEGWTNDKFYLCPQCTAQVAEFRKDLTALFNRGRNSNET